VPPVRSFPPVAERTARILILGSMPGERSLAANEYYANPHNAFWGILGELCGAGAELVYAERLRRLRASGIALWDVLQSCERRGSLDADIVPSSIVVNDFARLFARCPAIAAVFCNGGTAHTLWRRHVGPCLPAALAALPVVRLPSTSPAHAGLPPDRKLAAWRGALRPFLRSRTGGRRRDDGGQGT
jgi:hypoxanthine-DNA glycosylase